MSDPKSLVMTWKRIAVVGAILAALIVAVAIKSCADKPDPYRLKISNEDGFELVVPQD